ncbi:MAG: DoxX family protein [Bacteroidia bacterium]
MDQFFITSPTALMLVRIGFSAFFSILFLQSGLDKLKNFRENLSSISGHFSATFLSSLAPLLFIMLTVFELLAGFLSAYGIVELIIHNSPRIAMFGALFSMASLLSVFFGQRIAKDYGGAAGISSYFIVSALAVIVLS